MFFKEVNEIDLGETTIANIFIDIFMPMANGLYVKVYLLGFRQACETLPNPKFSNNSIAKNLGVPLADVIDAWRFWESKNIIKLHKNNDLDEYDYSVEFLDLKKFYIENIYGGSNSIKSSSDSIVSVYENPSIIRMFSSINKLVGRYLDPNEKIAILDIMDKYNMSCDMILCAYEYVKDKHHSPKPVKYMESIIRGWYDSNFYTPQEVKNSLANRGERYMMYKTIFNELGFYRSPSKAEERIIDAWIDDYGMDIEIILSACSKAKNISNPSISYINGIIEKWKNSNVKTLSDVAMLDAEHKQKTTKSESNNSSNTKNYKPVKTRFHNINQRADKYSNDELEKMILKNKKDN